MEILWEFNFKLITYKYLIDLFRGNLFKSNELRGIFSKSNENY